MDELTTTAAPVTCPELNSHGYKAHMNPDIMPLPHCHGDCDHDAHCQPGYRCFVNHEFTKIPGCAGMPDEAMDYCVREHQEDVNCIMAAGNGISGAFDHVQAAASMSAPFDPHTFANAVSSFDPAAAGTVAPIDIHALASAGTEFDPSALASTSGGYNPTATTSSATPFDPNALAGAIAFDPSGGASAS